MNDDDRPSEVPSPFQREVVLASLACFGSLLFIYWLARPALERLDVGWAGLLVYAIIPLTVTFVILFHSGWHREIARTARAGLVLLLSSVILAGVVFAIGVMLFLLWFCFNAVSGGNH